MSHSHRTPPRSPWWALGLAACLSCASKVDVDRGPAPPLNYVVDDNWPRLPPGRTLRQVSGVAVDSAGRFVTPHGIVLDARGRVYVAELGTNRVRPQVSAAGARSSTRAV
jgi:hypothetical protein